MNELRRPVQQKEQSVGCLLDVLLKVDGGVQRAVTPVL